MKIKKLKGIITKTLDLSPTAKDIEIKLSEEMPFEPGSFVNIFMDINSEKIRRAYSVSSSNKNTQTINISVRLTPEGKMSPEFWKKEVLGKEIEIMGPLGLNTANKMLSGKKYLFGFGIGAGVIKSLAEHFTHDKTTKELIIYFGQRFDNEILYKDFFDNLKHNFEKVIVKYVISKPSLDSAFLEGYIQDNIDQHNFDNCDIYVCGQEKACEQLIEKIKLKNPNNCHYFIEGFH